MKSVVSRVGLERDWYNIEYEGLHIGVAMTNLRVPTPLQPSQVGI